MRAFISGIKKNAGSVAQVSAINTDRTARIRRGGIGELNKRLRSPRAKSALTTLLRACINIKLESTRRMRPPHDSILGPKRLDPADVAERSPTRARALACARANRVISMLM